MKKVNQACTIDRLVLCLLFTCVFSGRSETWTIPQGAESRENTGTIPYPFAPPGNIRSQQIYSSSLFPALSEPDQLFQLDGLAFRLSSAGTFGGGASASFDRVEILVSSGNRPITREFAANHGANLKVVYDGPLTLAGNVPPGTTPSLFELAIAFQNSFQYDPSAGALIVEIRKSGPGQLSGLGSVDMPGLSFIWETGFGVDSSRSIGLETLFSYQVVPEPSVAAISLLGFLFVISERKRIPAHRR